MSDKEFTEIEWLDYTIKTFQPYYKKRILTREDARQITQNMVGFFSTLIELEESIQRNVKKTIS